MKKRFVLFCVGILVFASLAACAGGGSTASDGFQTIGEAMKSTDVEELQYGAANNTFVYAYEQDGVYYRLIAPMTEEQFQTYIDLDIFAPDYETQRDEILAKLKVETCENLTEKMPADEELKKYIGKTGQELLDDGWTTGSYDTYEMKIWMEHGLFSYVVVFDGSIEVSEDEDIDIEEEIKPLTVKSIEIDGLGDVIDGE